MEASQLGWSSVMCTAHCAVRFHSNMSQTVDNCVLQICWEVWFWRKSWYLVSYIHMWLGEGSRVIYYEKTSILMKSGVPQGSALSPVVFLVFLDYQFDGVECVVLVFADDCSLLVKGKTMTELEVNLKLRLTTSHSGCLQKTWHVNHRNPSSSFSESRRLLWTIILIKIPIKKAQLCGFLTEFQLSKSWKFWVFW